MFLLRSEVIRNRVFPFLTWLVIVMTVGAYTTAKMLEGFFGFEAASFAQAILLTPVGLIGVTVLYFLFFIIAYFTAKIKIVNVAMSTLFAMFTGIGLFGSIFYIADLVNAKIVPEALILTSGVFIIAVIYQFITKKDLSHWSWWLLFLLLVAIGLTIAEIFVQASWFRIAVDLGIVLLFIFLVMYDTYQIRERLQDNEWVLGALNFFLDFANILIRIIVILIEIYSRSS